MPLPSRMSRSSQRCQGRRRLSTQAPASPLEYELAHCWAKVLDREQIGRHDDFFMLGGHSLLVMRLVNLLQQRRIEITVADLFKHPTVASLAEHLRADTLVATPAGAVPVRPGGSRRPLFLIHENTGQDMWFSWLGRHIDEDVPVYGLSAVPLGEPQLQTVEGMAARLCRILRAVQPEGPYRLAGWSLGGVLAYELAVQLIGQDQTVEFLGIIDAGCPMFDAGEDRPPFSPPSAQKHLVALCGQMVRRVALSPGQLAALAQLRETAEDFDFAELFRRCKELGLLGEVAEDHASDQIRRYIDRLRAHEHAIAHYSVQPLPIPVHLFAAQEKPTLPAGMVAPDKLLGWGAIVPARNLTLIEVPGDHRSLMAEPNLRVLAEALSQAVRAREAQPIETPEASYQPVVSIQTRRRSGRTPIFCIPGAGDGIVSFLGLAAAFGPEWPIYGLQPRGVEGTLLPHSTVEAAAASYHRAISGVHPAGPLHLVGHSFGGWIAFEIAQRMLASGRPVTSLTVIDSDPPGITADHGGEYTATAALTDLIRTTELAAEKPLGIDLEAFALKGRSAQLRLLHRGMVGAGLLPKRSEPEALHGVTRTFATALRTTYRPRGIYPMPLRLVLARRDSEDGRTCEQLYQEALTGWKQWASSIDYWQSSGNHFSALKPPHVTALANWWHG